MAASKLTFDPEALRAKYRAERDKRVREDGNEQYLEVKGDFARFVEDPYVVPGFQREPLTDDVDVAVIGGGFGGLLVGARLREAGVEDIRLIEKGGDFGGTWYWNRYPGAACDDLPRNEPRDSAQHRRLLPGYDEARLTGQLGGSAPPPGSRAKGDYRRLDWSPRVATELATSGSHRLGPPV